MTVARVLQELLTQVSANAAASQLPVTVRLRIGDSFKEAYLESVRFEMTHDEEGKYVNDPKLLRTLTFVGSVGA